MLDMMVRGRAKSALGRLNRLLNVMVATVTYKEVNRRTQAASVIVGKPKAEPTIAARQPDRRRSTSSTFAIARLSWLSSIDHVPSTNAAAMSRQSQILTIAGVTAVGGLLAYAVYFDYKRRNDAAFRKKLRGSSPLERRHFALINTLPGSQKKKVNKVVAETKEKEISDAKASLEIPPEALKELHEAANKEELPTGTEARHQYFIETVSRAEALLQGGMALSILY